MAKSKLSDIELRIKNHTPPEINYSFQRSVSYSQYSIYATCPHQWYLSYIENKNPYQASIHTVFGTAFHETLQKYIEVMYNESGAAADRIDLEALFQERFRTIYSEEYEKTKEHFSNATEMREFFDDGIAILQWIKTRRNKLFTVRKVKLLGIEMPLLVGLNKNVYLKGYIDFVLYDEELNKVYIYDIKTSTRGWGEREKKDSNKLAQILLYKEYFGRQFRFDPDRIEVEYFIVKRKIWEASEFPIPRVQSFKPASGKTKRRQAVDKMESFIKDCFDEFGKPQIKSYLKQVGESSCKWCPYKDKLELCDKNVVSV
jgi:hypothetical protein